MILHVDVRDWFAKKLANLDCSIITKSYIINVLSNIRTDENMMHDQSITLAWMDAKTCGSFVKYQKIGDWVLWVKSIHPQSINDNQELIDTIGSLSYYACYRLLSRKWTLYEELADNLSRITTIINRELNQNEAGQKDKDGL